MSEYILVGRSLLQIGLAVKQIKNILYPPATSNVEEEVSDADILGGSDHQNGSGGRSEAASLDE